MKKAQLFIIILIVIVIFATGDYLVNAPGTIKTADITTQSEITTQVEDPYPNLIQELLDFSAPEFNYTIVKRERSKQIFEKFDLSTLKNAIIHANALKSEESDAGSPIVIYEIQGKKNQGALIYQNLKLKIIDQMASKGTVNEVTDYGYNAFFYNDPDNENTGYLVSQIKDNIFGFQYSKANADNFNTIKSMTNALMEIDLII